jgi:alpha-amylase
VTLGGQPVGPIISSGFGQIAINVGNQTAATGTVSAFDAALNRTVVNFNLGTSAVKRTVVLIYGQTQPGQDMFIRGGIDHGYASQMLGRNCTSTNMQCGVPIVHRNLKNDTTKPWKAADTYLDWYGAQPGQSPQAQGSPLDWTTNTWPAAWGPEKTVAADGYGTTPLNLYGQHYWMLDVDMDCSATVNGWFELKSYISNGPGWEGDVSQAGAPYISKNHFAQCGRINVFQRNSSSAVFADF